MKVQKGLIVKAIAGRDSEGFFVVTETGKDVCFIADGKSRKLASPKLKKYKAYKLDKQYD